MNSPAQLGSLEDSASIYCQPALEPIRWRNPYASAAAPITKKITARVILRPEWTEDNSIFSTGGR